MAIVVAPRRQSCHFADEVARLTAWPGLIRHPVGVSAPVSDSRAALPTRRHRPDHLPSREIARPGVWLTAMAKPPARSPNANEQGPHPASNEVRPVATSQEDRRPAGRATAGIPAKANRTTITC